MAGEAAAAVILGALGDYLLRHTREQRLVQLYNQLKEARQNIMRDIARKIIESTEGEIHSGTVEEALQRVTAAIAAACRQHEREINAILSELERLGEDSLKAALESTVEDCATVLRLGEVLYNGVTLADLLYSGENKLVDKLHEIIVTLCMRYAEIRDNNCEPRSSPEAAEKLMRLAELDLTSSPKGGVPASAGRFGATLPTRGSAPCRASGTLPLSPSGLGAIRMLYAPTRSALSTLFNFVHLNSPRLILLPHLSSWIGHLDEVYASSM
jgi:hypothetical protein